MRKSESQHLLVASSLLNIDLCQDDILILLYVIDYCSHHCLHATRKVEYLRERLIRASSKDEWRHSVLNKDEDRALRYWYLTRGNSVPMTDDNWHSCLEELGRHSYVDELTSRCYGIDVENINRSKVIKFANSCTVVKPPKHKEAKEKKEKVAKVKPLSLDELVKMVAEMDKEKKGK